MGKAKESLSKADVEELGAALREHEVALAVVGDAALPERAEQVLAGAKRRIAKELDLTKEDLGQAMQEAEEADGPGRLTEESAARRGRFRAWPAG